jgi:hypothetical protein
MSILNLEPICARWGRAMIEAPTKNNSLADQENTITKALGVLAENGLYAMGVFLVSGKNKKYGETVLTKHIAGLWEEVDPSLIEGEKDKREMLDAIQKIAGDLPKLILAKKLAEQAMIFARHHAKAEITTPLAI